MTKHHMLSIITTSYNSIKGESNHFHSQVFIRFKNEHFTISTSYNSFVQPFVKNSVSKSSASSWKYYSHDVNKPIRKQYSGNFLQMTYAVVGDSCNINNFFTRFWLADITNSQNTDESRFRFHVPTLRPM